MLNKTHTKFVIVNSLILGMMIIGMFTVFYQVDKIVRENLSKADCQILK